MEMEKKKKDYEAPDIKVTQVEIESSICNGSVEFKGENETQVNIAEQGVQDMSNGTETFNDFSKDFWNMPGTDTGSN